MMYRDPQTNPSQANPDVKLAGVQYEYTPNATYGEHIKNTAAICNSSASHTYGNVISVVEKYLTDEFNKFAPDTFKTVVASTTLASRQLIHLPQQLHKRELPIMVMAPRIVFGQDENRFLGHTMVNDRITDVQSLYGEGNLLPLAHDVKNELYIHGKYNRAVMYVDIVLSFNTYSEQVNFMANMYNMLTIGHNKFIRAPLELYIPDEFCTLLSNLIHIPINDKDKGGVYDFLTYMNTIWNYPITYKLNGGSNTDEFFMYYMADIDTVINDIQAGQGVKDGQIKRGFDISFTVRCEFNTVGYFTLNAPSLTKQTYIPSKDKGTIVPIFSDVINLDDFKLPVGWAIYSWPVFKLSKREDGSIDNTISLQPILNQSLNVMIDHHLKFGIPMSKLINIQFRENGHILTDEAFHIDWSKRELVLHHPNYRRTYRLIITVANEYINNTIVALYGLE